MKISPLVLCVFCVFYSYSQVGIGTVNPNAQLEVKSSNQAIPSNKDGILIPKLDVFPAIQPTAAQHSMLIYLTTASGLKTPGFYYWNNTIPDWVPLGGNDTTPHNTLDMAYDQGANPGDGREITADSGMVLISGTDGLRTTGVIESGSYLGVTTGIQMFFYPRRGAFRAGTSGITGSWEDVDPGPGGGPGIGNIGNYSVAMGSETTASGKFSLALVNGSSALAESAVAIGNGAKAKQQDDVAIGQGALADGLSATAIGYEAEALGESSISFGYKAHSLGDISTAIGNSSQAHGDESTAIGNVTQAHGDESTAIGYKSQAHADESTAIGYKAHAFGYESLAIGMSVRTDSFREFAVGSINTNGGGNATAWVATDRLFSIGNGIPVVAPAVPIPSNALVILKNGNTGIGSDNPTSKLQVVGLPIVPFNTNDITTNADALGSGLTVGAFYHTGNGFVKVVF